MATVHQNKIKLNSLPLLQGQWQATHARSPLIQCYPSCQRPTLPRSHRPCCTAAPCCQHWGRLRRRSWGPAEEEDLPKTAAIGFAPESIQNCWAKVHLWETGIVAVLDRLHNLSKLIRLMMTLVFKIKRIFAVQNGRESQQVRALQGQVQHGWSLFW